MGRIRQVASKIYLCLIKYVPVIYLFFLLLVFPGYIWDKYWEMSYRKWTFYVAITIPFLLLILFMNIIRRILKEKKKYCFADLFVILYGVFSTVSFIYSASPQAAFMGTDGWYMGYVAQLFFVLTYLSFSSLKVKSGIVIGLNCVGSLYCFVVAIFQRYGNDFLHLYYNLPDEVVRDYLSTIGNRTWFSAYVCAVCPIGIYMFWRAKTKVQKILFGIYTYFAFACIVVTNSDSAYVGIFAVLYILLILSFQSMERIKRFCLVLVLWSSACLGMALLRIPYAYIVRELRGLSKIFLNMKFAIVFAIISAIAFCVAWMLERSFATINTSKIRKWTLGITIAAIGFIILLIIFNTTGVLQRLFCVTIQNKYLLFNENWGDYRGSSWMLTVKMFFQLPFKQKLFGVGPDCFAYYAYGNSEYSQYLNYFWGDTILANAHNEWLNQFLCMGLFGGMAYIAIFIYIMIQCVRCTDEKRAIVPAIGLCIAGYMAHNFFCYQQVSATGVIFVLMGIAMCKLKETKEYREIRFFQDKNKKWRLTK